MSAKIGDRVVETTRIRNEQVANEIAGLITDLDVHLAMLARNEQQVFGNTRMADAATKAIVEIAVRLELV